MSDFNERIASLTPEKRALFERHLLQKKNAFPAKNQAILRRGTSDPCVLSFNQERLWLYNEMEPDIPNIIPYTLRMRGDLNRYALEKALDTIVLRHESLRTTFSSETGEPLQVIHQGRSIHMSVFDLGSWPEPKRETEVQRLIDGEEQRLFDLSTDLMLMATLIRLSDTEHILVLTMHHIASDGWSMGIFFRELLALYSAFEGGKPSPLPDLPIQYADFACWQRKWMQGEVLEKQLSYWQKQLADIPAVLELPADRPRPAVRSFQGSSHGVILPEILVDRLKGLSKQEGVTMFTLMTAAFKTLLHRYSGQGDISVGTYTANRNRVEIEDMIGFFVNTLVLRTNLSDDPGFRELLQREHEVALGAFAHQDIPFEKLLEAVNPKRDLSYTPLFQVALSYENMPRGDLELPNLSFKFMSLDPSVSLYDMTLIVTEIADGMEIYFAYRTDIFDASTIKRWADNFLTLLESIVANPEQRIRTLPLLTEAERRQVVVEWNETETDYPEDMCVHELFEAQAQQTPDAIAVVYEGQELTYRELNSRANQLAHYLRNQGVGPEVLVGICVDRSLEMLVGLLGILKAGGAYVPMDPAYPQERLKLMLEDADIAVLLTQKRLCAGLPLLKGELVCLDTDWNEIASESDVNLTNTASLNNAAYVIYTSGSTGKPKGVMVEHKSLANYTRAAISQYGIKFSDRILQFASISFDASAEEIYPSLAQGATIVLRTDEMLNSVSDFLHKCEEWKLTVSSLPTAYWHILALSLEIENLKIPASVRLLIIGGERALPERLIQWHRHAEPHVRILNTYGPTEATVVATVFDLTHFNDDSVKNVPIGRPLPHVQIYILDSHLQPLPVGACGELYIGGPGLARGYLNRPDMTAEKFIPNPFSKEKGERLYKTGDLARYLPDGNIEFLGRIDNQVKIRGFRIELGEVEAVLGLHPSVRETVAIARENHWGDKGLVAYVVPNQEKITTSDLRNFLKEKLPDYMIPFAFVVLNSLPLTPNGKVDRKALPDHDSERFGLEDSFIGPRTTTEELLACIWCEVLGRDQVGVHDNFFDLGGHSLLATQVISRLRNAFHVEIPLRRLFETPTIAGLTEVVMAALIAREQQSAPPFVAVSREDELPLSYAQERLWFHNQLEPNTSYNIPLALRIRGDLNRYALEKALDTIVLRHESLRTTFSSETGEPLQVIHQGRSIHMSVFDLGSWPEPKRETEVQRLIDGEEQRLFDLSTDLMLMATLIRLSDTEHILVLTMHHIASDGWSMGIFFRELLALYSAFEGGKPSPLPDLPIQYADFACWQRKWMQGEVLEKQLSYWQKQLADIPAVLELPADRPRPAVRSLQGASHGVILPEILVDRLKQLCKRECVTMFTLMTAAFKTLLHRYSGQGDICVGTFVANRNRVEIEDMIGFFVNTLVLRTNLSDDPGFRELLQREHEVALGAFAHQDIPFEKLLEAVNPKRDLSYTPLFQVALSYENMPRGDLELPNLSFKFMSLDPSVSLYDMTLIVTEIADGMEIYFAYRTDIFDASTIKRWADNFLTLLESIVANPEQRIRTLPLLTEAERRQVVVEWNETETDYPEDMCVHELFEAQAQQTPDAIAVVFKEQQLTYRELNSQTNQLAHYLKKRGVAHEVWVGICVERSLEMIIGMLAILKAGGAYVPLDPSYPQERLRLMLEDTGISILLTQERLCTELPLLKAELVCLDSDWNDIARESDENLTNTASLNNAAYVIHTSGSTGKSKGVVIQHASLLNFTNAVISRYGIEPSDRILQFASISFDASAEEIYPCLARGATLVLRTDDMLSSVHDFLLVCSEWKLTVLSLPTAYWHELTRGLDTEDLRMPDSIRLVIIGGEKASPERLIQWHHHVGTRLRLLNTYGPTEATVVATLCDLTYSDSSAGPAKAISIGRPMPNVQIYILDPFLQPVPIGAPGELHIGGKGLARGYHNRPELTAEKFIPNPLNGEPEARLYRTGDLARYLPDGSIEFLGRIDNQLKIRGFRIEPDEIESVLAQHPAVTEAAVIAREDQPGNRQLVAYVVANEKAAVTSHELRNFLRQKLPDYMIPSAFVVLDALPLTPNGKIDRMKLPAPDSARPDLKDSYVAPRSPIEEVLTGIWREVLGRSQVGVHDNFFEIGGHSLLATQVISRVRLTFDTDVPLRCLFESPTVAGLATALLQRTDETEKLEKRSELLLKVAELSEEEVNTMLEAQIHQKDSRKYE